MPSTDDDLQGGFAPVDPQPGRGTGMDMDATTPSAKTAMAWSRWLLDNTGDHLDEAVAEGLKVDPLAIATAYIAHGTQVGMHVADVSKLELAAYLRGLADSVEIGMPYLPLLVSLDSEG